MIAIRCGSLLDGRRSEPLRDVLLVIEGRRIRAVEPGGALPADATRVIVDHLSELERVTFVMLGGRVVGEDWELSAATGGARRRASGVELDSHGLDVHELARAPRACGPASST